MKHKFPVAMITLPKVMIPQDGMVNLHGYWTPPDFVLEFWGSACYILYHGDKDYDEKKSSIHKSYMECIAQFYRDNAF